MLSPRRCAKKGSAMTVASVHAWFNGELTPRETGAPSIASISFHLGTGVFDGLMAYWNRDHYYLHRAEEHFVRFRAGAARMGLAFRWTVVDLIKAVEQLLAAEQPHTQYVRPIAYRRAPELWITGSEGREVDVSIFTVKTARDSEAGIACHVSPVERISSRAIPSQTKVSGAYVNSFYARKTAELAGYEDGIMLDREGRVTEASAANLFVIAPDHLVTPPLNPDVFPGVTRRVVMELARAAGIDVHERNLHAADLARADGVFVCSTLMEIRGVSRLGERALPTLELPIFRGLLSRFRDLTHERAVSN